MADDLRGYTEQEVLNKVLNTSNDSIKVDITSGAEYAEDSAHSTTNTGNFVLGVRNDTLAALGGTDGDYVAFQMNADGALYVDVANGGVLESAVDGLETLLTGIDADTDAIKTAVQLIDNAIDGSQMQVDVVAISAQSDGTYIGDIKFGESLPAGSAAIGKLAANSGVDIGDVDVTSVIPGVAATNLGKAIQSAQGSTDTGVAALAVRNDALADLSGADGDYTPLQVNKTGALNVTENTGYLGAIFEDGTDNITSKKVVAIQFLEDTTFTTLTPVDSSYIGTASGNGDAIDTSNTFPQGMTIFGRWTGFRLASGTIVAYQGDW